MTIINRARRKAGLPKRRLVFVEPPPFASRVDGQFLIRTIAKQCRPCDVVLMPPGYVVKVAP